MTLVEGEKECSSCDKSETQATLFNILLPPLINKRTNLCSPCLKVAIDDSKKKGKALEK
jgi:hypothetical protein